MNHWHPCFCNVWWKNLKPCSPLMPITRMKTINILSLSLSVYIDHKFLNFVKFYTWVGVFNEFRPFCNLITRATSSVGSRGWRPQWSLLKWPWIVQFGLLDCRRVKFCSSMGPWQMWPHVLPRGFGGFCSGVEAHFVAGTAIHLKVETVRINWTSSILTESSCCKKHFSAPKTYIGT